MSQIANVIEMRREAERDFVRAAACGIVQRVIEADSVLAVCPAGLITHDLQAQAVYSAISAIAASRSLAKSAALTPVQAYVHVSIMRVVRGRVFL